MQHSKFTQVGPVSLPLDWGGTVRTCTLRYFSFPGQRYLVAEIGDIDPKNPDETLIRIQSACTLGDLFESRWCDCAWQLHEAKRLLFASGKGLLIYGYDQNGKGLSLEDHYRVYAEGQAHEMELLTETFDMLGFSYENRHYEDIASIIGDFYQISQIKLLTNDPVRINFFEMDGFAVERVGIQPPVDKYNVTELRIKKQAFGHLIEF